MKILLQLLILSFLFVGVDVNAQFRPAQKQYIGNNNALTNPGFEQGYKGWTITGCTKSLVSDIPLLDKTLKLTCTAETFSIKQETTDLTSFASQQGVTSFQVKTTASGVKAASLKNGSRDISLDLNAGEYKQGLIPFVIDSTSNGIEIYSDTSFTGEVYVDLAELGLAPIGFAKEINDTDTDWIDYTPTTQGFGTVSDLEFQYKRIGDSTLIKGSFVCGTPNTSEAQVTLPSVSVVSSEIEKPVGIYFKNNDTGAVTNRGGTLIATGGDSYVTFSTPEVFRDSGGSSADPIATDTGISVCSTGQKIYLTSNQIPIEGWETGKVTAVAQQTEKTPENSNFIAGFYDSGDSSVIDQIPGSFGGGVTKIGGGNNAKDIAVNPGIFTEAPICVMGGSDDSSGTIDVVYQRSNSTATSLRFRTKKSSDDTDLDKDFNFLCYKTPNDFNKNQAIIGKFEQIEEISGDLTEETSNNSKAIINNSASVVSQQYDYIDSCTGGGTNSITCTYNAGLFTQTPSVDVTGVKFGGVGITAELKSFDSSGFSIIFRRPDTGAGFSDWDEVTVDIGKQGADVNKSFKGAVVNASKQGIKCQTKYLSSDVTTNTTVSDLGFSNLDTSKKYRLYANALFSEAGGGQDSLILTTNDGTSDVCENSDSVTTGVLVQTFKVCDFSPQSSSLTVTSTSVSSGNAIRGDGTVKETFYRLCELNDFYTETNEW